MKQTLFFLIWASLVFASAAGADETAGTPPWPDDGPLVIRATLFLLDVSKIDGADQSFTADIFMLLQWHDARLASSAEGLRRVPLDSIWNPRVQIINQRRIWKNFPESADIFPDGKVVARQRYYGLFASPLDLRDFPLDQHQFSVQIVVPGYAPEEVQLAVNSVGFERFRSPEMTIPDWTIGEFELRQRPWSIVPGGRQIAGLEGTFMAKDGQAFLIFGDKAQELNQNIGKQVEIKGTVQEKEGKSTISITEYKLIETPASEVEATASDTSKEKPAPPKE